MLSIYIIQGPFPSSYRVSISCVGGLHTHTHSPFEQSGVDGSSSQLSSSYRQSSTFILYSAAMLRLFQYCVNNSMRTAHLKLLTACLPPSRGAAAHDFLFLLFPMLSEALLQTLTGIFFRSSFYWYNLEHPSFICISSCPWLELFPEEGIRHPWSKTNLSSWYLILISLQEQLLAAIFFFFTLPFNGFLYCTKKSLYFNFLTQYFSSYVNNLQQTTSYTCTVL